MLIYISLWYEKLLKSIENNRYKGGEHIEKSCNFRKKNLTFNRS